MIKRKCTNCGSTNLVEQPINFDFSEGVVDSSMSYVYNKDYGKVVTYLCRECGHIEFYAEKKEENKRKVKMVI